MPQTICSKENEAKYYKCCSSHNVPIPSHLSRVLLFSNPHFFVQLQLRSEPTVSLLTRSNSMWFTLMLYAFVSDSPAQAHVGTDQLLPETWQPIEQHRQQNDPPLCSPCQRKHHPRVHPIHHRCQQ